MKKWIVTVLGLSVVVVQAASFMDDFNRTNVGATSDGSAIGENYVITSVTGTGEFALLGNDYLVSSSASANHRVISYQGFEIQNTNGLMFEVSVDMTITAYNTAINSGLAFNFQDSMNFYAARLKPSSSSGASDGALYFLQVLNGTGATFAAGVGGLDIETDTVYTLTITSSEPGTFSYSLVGGTVDQSGIVADGAAGGDFSGGYVGIYQSVSGSTVRYDNLSVSTAPVTEVSFADDFNRTNVGATSDGSAIGADYVITSVTGTGEFALLGNDYLVSSSASANHRVISYQGFEVQNTNGLMFEVSVDMTITAYNTAINSGLAFNFQDSMNFYAARLKPSSSSGASDGALYFLQIVNGAGATFAAGVGGLDIETDTVYTLTITSSEPGTFSYSLVGGTVDQSGVVSDGAAGGDFSGGYVGIYQSVSGSTVRYDNFFVSSSIPTQSEESYVGNVGVAWMGLEMILGWEGQAAQSYAVQCKTNLTSGVWSNLVTGIAGAGGTLFVTNSANERQAFYRIVVE